MGAPIIYCIRPSDDDDSPFIDTQRPENSSKNVPWGAVGNIVLRSYPAADCPPIRLSVHEDGWENWHYYTVAGTLGLYSETLLGLIGQYMKPCLEPCLKAFVNDVPFLFPRPVGSLDCLDHEHSEVIRYPHAPDRIMRIKRYRFFKDRIADPSVFLVPETLTEVFATSSIKKMVEDAGYEGINFVEAATLN